MAEILNCLWKRFNEVLPINSEFSSFFLDSFWVKCTKLNDIFGFTLALSTFITSNDPLEIASASLAVVSTIVSFRLNRVKRNN